MNPMDGMIEYENAIRVVSTASHIFQFLYYPATLLCVLGINAAMRSDDTRRALSWSAAAIWLNLGLLTILTLRCIVYLLASKGNEAAIQSVLETFGLALFNPGLILSCLAFAHHRIREEPLASARRWVSVPFIVSGLFVVVLVSGSIPLIRWLIAL